MTAVLEVSKHMLDALPNIELVSFLIIVYTMCFGVRKTLATIYLYVLAECMLFGFGLWSVSYLYVWDVLVLLVVLFKKSESALFFACISGAFGLMFGALCAIVTLVIGGWSMAFTWWVAGIPYDLVHCFGNFFICLLLYTPVRRGLDQIRRLSHL